MESFDGLLRGELLNETPFLGLDHARQEIAAWVADYNTRRPHSSIVYKTPAAYAAHLNEIGRPAAQSESSASQPVAHFAPRCVTNGENLVIVV